MLMQGFLLLLVFLLLASLQHDVLAVACSSLALTREVFRFRRKTFFIPLCRKSLTVPPGGGPFSFPNYRKAFWSLKLDHLHSHMKEKSSGPWKETFFIPTQQIVFGPWGDIFFNPNAGKVLLSM